MLEEAEQNTGTAAALVYSEFAMPVFLCRALALPFSVATLVLHIANTANASTRTFAFKTAELARQYGVAQSTVSEALATLKQLGWVTDMRVHGRNGVSGLLGPMFGPLPREANAAVKAYIKHLEVRPDDDARDLIVQTVKADRESLAMWWQTLYAWAREQKAPTDVAGLCQAYTARRAFGAAVSHESTPVRGGESRHKKRRRVE